MWRDEISRVGRVKRAVSVRGAVVPIRYIKVLVLKSFNSIPFVFKRSAQT